ncbi:protein of unknown function; Putative tranposase (fragment) [Bradyrhizobium sp. ORS 285]
MQIAALDEPIAEDHPVRPVWAFVEALDLSPLYDLVKATEIAADIFRRRRSCWLRFGCGRRLKVWAVPASWTGCAANICTTYLRGDNQGENPATIRMRERRRERD